MEGWIGHPISEIEELWGPATRKTKKNDGTIEYRFDRPKIDPSCVHYWLVDSRGTIIGMRYEGLCHPIG